MRYQIHEGDNLEWLRAQPDNSIDSVCTDPPYGLGKEPNALEMLQAWIDHDYLEVAGAGFMGRKWDAFVPQPIFWKEVYRVLKPGGHVLSFAGTRTYDWMVMAIRLAGFEIRDQLIWMYGGGFPKSHNVGKGIDKVNGEIGRATKFTEWMRSTGMKSGQLDQLTNSFMGGHYLTQREQAAIPTAEMWAKIRPEIKVEIPEWVDLLIDRIEAERVVVGINTKARAEGSSSALPTMGAKTEYQSWDLTAPATPEAQEWDGWGTALSPSHEPIVLARKPIERGLTVAANVLKWGTGAINVDGCRIGTDVIKTMGGDKFPAIYGTYKTCVESEHKGRWPSNLLLANVPSVLGLFPENAKSGTGAIRKNADGLFGLGGDGVANVEYGDSGSASRYFFRADLLPIEIEEQLSIEQKAIYCSKPSKYERSLGVAGEMKESATTIERHKQNPNGTERLTPMRSNFHPTVKPVALMHHLTTLITPPNGVCLDPFLGSGTTGIGAMLAGPNIRFIGLEFTPEYIPIIHDRMKNWKKYRQFIEVKEGDAPARVVAAKAKRASHGEQQSLFQPPV